MNLEDTVGDVEDSKVGSGFICRRRVRELGWRKMRPDDLEARQWRRVVGAERCDR